MLPKIAAIGGGTVLAIFAFGACTAAVTHRSDPNTTPHSYASAPYETPALPTAAGPVDAAQVPPPPPPLPNPLTSDGVWRVPEDIKPGTYRAVPTKSYGGYFALCSDYTCAIGTGMIRNEMVTGPEVFTIPETAASIKLSRLNLTSLDGGN